MINIDIVCLNYNTSKQISEKIVSLLNQSGKEAIFINPYNSLFSQGMRIFRTHEGIETPKQSAILLDAARDWEIRFNISQTIPNFQDKIYVSPISPAVEAISTTLTIRKDLKRVPTRHIVKKLMANPDYIIYFSMSPEMIRDMKDKRVYNRKVEMNMKGQGLKYKCKNYPESLVKLTEMIGSKCCIIEVSDPYDISGLANKALEFIKENPPES